MSYCKRSNRFHTPSLRIRHGLALSLCVRYCFRTPPLGIGDSDTQAIRIRQRQRSPLFCLNSCLAQLA